MDDLTREQYTSPWWPKRHAAVDGPTALVLGDIAVRCGDHDLVTAARRRVLRDALTPHLVENPVDEDAG
jgi:hypothetical protein